MLVSDWIEIKKTGEINCRYIPDITLNISTYLFISIFNIKRLQRNWDFTTKSNFRIPISFQPDYENLWYFKLRLFDLTVFIVFEISREYDFGD